MQRRRQLLCCGLLLAVGLSMSQAAAEAAEPITIFAAASTTDAVSEIATLYEKQSGQEIRPVFAASSTLARQITQGAPADLYLSANPQWMDHLERQGLIEASTRLDLLSNDLVLVIPSAQADTVTIAPGFDLLGLLDERPLALADPDHVPAGIYAKAALVHLDVWDGLKGHLAYAANVRAALALVDRGEAGAGIVYASDAVLSARTKVAGVFPAASHPPIRYPLAIIADKSTPAVVAFHAFLRGAESAVVFRARGFTLPGAGS